MESCSHTGCLSISSIHELVCVVVVSYQEYSLTLTGDTLIAVGDHRLLVPVVVLLDLVSKTNEL